VIQPPQNGNFAEDAHGILGIFKYVSDSLDYNGCVLVVSVRAPAHLAIRAAPHPLVHSESARHVPHNGRSMRHFVKATLRIHSSNRRHCRKLIAVYRIACLVTHASSFMRLKLRCRNWRLSLPPPHRLGCDTGGGGGRGGQTHTHDERDRKTVRVRA